MPTHLYCLLPETNDLAPPAEGAVRALVAGGIVAWVGDVEVARMPRDRRRASLEAVLHDRVVGAALAGGITPLPATLSDPYPADEDLIADITARANEIRESLARVQGAVEMAVIIADAPASTPDDSLTTVAPGRAYLESIRGRPARLASLADRIEAALRDFSLASVRRVDEDRIGLSHLVRRELVSRYREAALGLATAGSRILVDGPRGPYSFAAFSPRQGPMARGAA